MLIKNNSVRNWHFSLLLCSAFILCLKNMLQIYLYLQIISLHKSVILSLLSEILHKSVIMQPCKVHHT